MRLRQLMVSSAMVVAAGAGANQARAQSATPPVSDQAATGAPSGASSDGIGEVVVTARRREERLQNVPVAAVAFDQSGLTEKAIVTSYQLAKSVPGLVVDAGTANPGVQQFSIRGRGLNFGAAAGSVETYFADVPLSAPFGMPTLPAQFFDIGSLSVLKGPQGTLFGRSTTGGAVVVVPQAPTPDFGGYVRLQGGTHGNFQAEGAINIPLAGDRAILRVAGFDWQRDGYMRTTPGINEVTGGPLPGRRYNNQDVKELRATLLLRPMEGLENSTLITYHTDHNLASAGPGLNVLGLGSPNGKGAFFSPGYGTKAVTYGFDPDHPSSKIFALVNTTTLEVAPSLTLKNIFGFIHGSGYTNDGNTGTGVFFPAVAIDTLTPPRPRKNTQYTDELQLQGSSFGDHLTWVLGGLVDITRAPSALDKLNYGNVDFLFGHLISILQQDNRDSYGLFASGTYKVTDKLNLTAGYRRSFDNVLQRTTGQLSGLVLAPTADQVKSFKKNQQGDTANVQMDYHLDNRTMIYGGWRLGYKRGGFNATSLPGQESFQPEKVNDFFLGAKSDFQIGQMPVRLNVEGYYDLYKGMQISYYELIGANFATITDNIPKTTFRGFEAELTAKPSNWLTLSGNYAFLDAYNTSWSDRTVAGMSGDLKDNPVPFASRNKFTATARLHTDLPGNMGDIALAPTVSYQSKYYTSPTAFHLTNSTVVVTGPFNMAAHGSSTVSGYTLVDLRAEWNHFLGSKINAAVNVTNLTNKQYFLGTSATLVFGAEAFAYAPPRMISFELSTKF